jgi:hypothetical protein
MRFSERAATERPGWWTDCGRLRHLASAQHGAEPPSQVSVLVNVGPTDRRVNDLAGARHAPDDAAARHRTHSSHTAASTTTATTALTTNTIPARALLVGCAIGSAIALSTRPAAKKS